MALCEGVTADGRSCSARAMDGSPFCFFHDPEKHEQRRQAQRKGGRRQSRLLANSPPREFTFSDPAEIAEFLAYVANRIVRGELDAKIANAVAYCADCALRAHGAGTIAERLARLERLQQAEENRGVSTTDYSSHFEDEEELKHREKSTTREDDDRRQQKIVAN